MDQDNNYLSEELKDRVIRRLMDRIKIINFVKVYETHMPELLEKIKEVMDDTVELQGKDEALRLFEMFFADNGVLHEYTWLRSFCKVYINQRKFKKYR
jgi:hypothetical protein